jgi:hypothetical protein
MIKVNTTEDERQSLVKAYKEAFRSANPGIAAPRLTCTFNGRYRSYKDSQDRMGTSLGTKTDVIRAKDNLIARAAKMAQVD